MAAKEKHCKANVGTRRDPRECGKPIAQKMLQCCADHRMTLIPTRTPGIYTRGGSYVVVTMHRGKQHKTFHRTEGEAREAKGNRTGSAKPAPQTRRPFDEYAREWVRSYQGRTQRGFDEDTRSAYRRALEFHAIPHFRSTPLRDIDRAAINALIAKLQRQGLSAASIAKYLAPVRALFSDAVGNGHLQANPALRLAINAKAAGGGSERVKDMTRAELAGILAAIPHGRDRLFFEVLAHTGCRISEALGLDWSDLGEDGAALRIERQWYRGKLKRYTKTANGMRTISLPPALARKLWASGADATGLMFHTRSGEHPSDRNMNRVLERAEKAAGLPHVSAHSFRHTHGSMLLDEGWPITEVAHRLGDDVQTVAKTYAHKMRDSKRDLSFLDALGSDIRNEEAEPESAENMGKVWAKEDPETTANATMARAAESAA